MLRTEIAGIMASRPFIPESDPRQVSDYQGDAKAAATIFHCHLDPDQLEAYVRNQVSGRELEVCEEHLLVCEECRAALEETAAYVAAMRGAASKLKYKTERQPRRLWSWHPVPVWAAGAAMVLLLIPLGVRLATRDGAASYQTITMRAVRGPTSESQAAAGKPLQLILDLSGLPRAASYAVEMVDQNGDTVWRKTITGGGAGSGIRANAPAPRAGEYFVRLYAAPDQLLRESALHVASGQ
jgi:hypothetical protein